MTPATILPRACTGIDFKRDCMNTQDNNVIRDGNTYYRFSHLWTPSTTNFDGIELATSPSLTGPWEVQVHNFPFGASPASVSPNNFPHDSLVGTARTWAPDVHKIKDTFYLCYTAAVYDTRLEGTRNITNITMDLGMATSTSLLGPWTDHGPLGIPSNNPLYTHIDGTLVQLPSGSSSLIFGSYSSGLFSIDLASPPLHITPGANLQNLITNQFPAENASGRNKREGAFHWRRNGYDYLFFNNGNCCNGNRQPPHN